MKTVMGEVEAEWRGCEEGRRPRDEAGGNRTVGAARGDSSAASGAPWRPGWATRAPETMPPAAQARGAPGPVRLPDQCGSRVCGGAQSQTRLIRSGLLEPRASWCEGPRRLQRKALGQGGGSWKALIPPAAQVPASFPAQALISWLIRNASVSFGVYFQNSVCRVAELFWFLGSLVRNEKAQDQFGGGAAFAVAPGLSPAKHACQRRKDGSWTFRVSDYWNPEYALLPDGDLPNVFRARKEQEITEWAFATTH